MSNIKFEKANLSTKINLNGNKKENTINTISRKPLNIFKFGGSCFKDNNSFEQSLKIVNKYNKNPLIIVCSALFGITNKLIEYGNSVYEPGMIKNAPEKILKEIRNKHFEFLDTLLKEKSAQYNEMAEFIDSKLEELKNYGPNIQKDGFTPKHSDYVVSFGERLSAFLYTEYLKAQGLDAQFIAADEELIITNNEFQNALPILEECEENIKKKVIPPINDNKIIVIPGFYGTNQTGEVTTLGRGGTDFTTTIIAYSLADNFDVSIIFWKDVYGLLSANPKILPKATLLKELSYAEAKELAYFGTKILHPKCLKMAEQKDVKTIIKNFDDPFAKKYTKIVKECYIPKRSNEIIKAITALDEIAMITVESDAMISLPGSAAKIFTLMGQNKININFISQCSSENNITFGTTLANGNLAKKILIQNEYFGKHWFNVKVDLDAALLSVVGAGMMHKPGVAGLLFTTLGNAGINIRAIAQGSSELNITFVISRLDVERAIKVIYNTFIEGNIPDRISRW